MPAVPTGSAPAGRRSSQRAILEAAIAEFSERGFDGVRLEHVAKRAGCNKALVYRYFGNRQGLFEAALRAKFLERRELLDGAPDDLGVILRYWFESTLADPHFMRLIQHEALTDGGGELVEEDYRRQYYQRQIDMLAEFQRQGAVSREFDTPYLFLALLALVVWPQTFPNISRLATGHAADSEEFRSGWSEMLAGLVKQLGS